MKYKNGDRVSVRLATPTNHQVMDHLGVVQYEVGGCPGYYSVFLDHVLAPIVSSDSMMQKVQPT